MYIISATQTAGFRDIITHYYKTEEGFIKGLRSFLKTWEYRCGYDFDTKNYDIEDVINNMWDTSIIEIEDEDGTNSLEWGEIHFED